MRAEPDGGGRMRSSPPSPAPRRTAGRVGGVLGAAALAGAMALGVAAPAHADVVRDAEYWLDEYGIRAAWQTTQGEGVTIAIIDTGVDPNVRELRGAVLEGADFSGLGDPLGWAPVGGEAGEHGTLVATMAAGRGSGPGSGVIGVAPGAKILPISIGFGGERDSDVQIAEAVRFAVDHGADVINMSLTRNTLEWPVSWDEAFLYAAAHDVVIVAAAGNRAAGTTVVGAPATMPGVLTVAGVDRFGNASEDASSQGITISVAAPSEELVGVAPGGGYRQWSGTSGSAPLVAGVVALVRAAHPELDVANVINRIVTTARDVGPAGQDAWYGYGLIDAKAAVSAIVPRVAANPMGDLAEWVRVYRPTESEPVPLPTPVVIVPEAPVIVATGARSPTGVLLPSIELLRAQGPAALTVTAFLAGLAGLGVWGWRGISRARDRR